MNHLTHIVHSVADDPESRKSYTKRQPGRFFCRFLMLTILITFFSGMELFADEVLVGGTLTENEVWTKEHIYIVFNDLRIPDSVTLVIRAGVTVKIDQGRGIFVLGGNLFVEGQEDDSVVFRPNYTRDILDWKWKGISYTGVNGEGENGIYYARISDAETAIDSYNSDDIVLSNISVFNSQNIGIRLFNSRNCRITDCQLQNNYDGIEMVATDGEEASGNRITNCLLNNENHNVYLLKAYGGILINNLVENNLIEGGNNGIWLDNGGGEAFGRNMIRKNIIIRNGAGAGYGLLVAQDSIDILNNIFWQNHIAVFYNQGTGGTVLANNSFYQNDDGILLSAGSVGNDIENNTFSMNSESIFRIAETQETDFHRNNLFTLSGQEKVVTNDTPDDIDLSHNFWYAAGEEEIHRLIWDKEDNPDLGEVSFIPVLPEADTTNPIAPPMNLIKQQVDNRVRVSWTTNPEKDLRAYKIYYGKFENYAFSNAEDAGNDTMYFMSDFDIHDTVAVTALDSAQMTNDVQVSGHESPFAFAEIYPYAGPDDKICKMHLEFHLQEATIPYDDNEFFWSTNGDGIFNDTHIIRPVYYPGQNDRENGQVTLTLTVVSHEITKKDSLILYIYDNPEVFAGNDTTLLADEQLPLTESGALYYETVEWTTLGDGIFDTATIMHPVYTPGPGDISSGMVNLVLTAISECGSSNDTLTLYLEPFYSVEGKVWHGGFPVNNSAVLAVEDKPEGARAVDLVQSGTDGFFRFDHITEGDYYIYAVPDTLTAGEAVPGYYAHKSRWQDAWRFHVDANTYDVDVTLPSVDYMLPEGSGSVSGYFVMPGAHLFTKDIYCNSWFDPNNILNYCDGGLSNITVFLYNTTGVKLLDYTLTDENGNFHFDGLPYGGYIIDAEKAGYETTVSSLITLSPDHQNETGVEIKLTAPGKIGISRSGQLPASVKTDVYPNPAEHYLYIPFPGLPDEETELYIYNATGQMVEHQQIHPDENMLLLKVKVGQLNAGIYFGRMIINDNATSFTFIKK